MDMVDIDLTIQTVKGIYTLRKDHTTESTIFTLWSKKGIPFPSLRWKIQAFQDDKRQEKQCHGMMAVNLSFLSLPRCLETQEREPLAKLEPGGWAEIGLTLQREEDPIPKGQKCQNWTKLTLTFRPTY